jgi:hypothetical protein
MSVKKVSAAKIKYVQAWNQIVTDLGRKGLVLSSYATTLGLSVAQMQAISKDKPEFGDSIDLAMSYALSYHEEQLALAGQTKGSQPQLTLAFLKSNWPQKYNVQEKSNAVGRGEKSVETVDSAQMVNQVMDLFEALVKASDPSDYSDEQKAIMLYKIEGTKRRMG